ncbi:hypothetical protein O181_008888 [Austropuccinia psidii MF-1]|uniref:Uncharacterized protein n=1 Tax=Austropuccinia psidii MF-1 TaxID=1389203 RepID=A0A9Q3BQ07_9BASI|nr:hypothetical protein [Austropuccinia psidii MF-1]
MDWETGLVPGEIQLAYSTSQNSTTGKSPSLVEKGWSPLLPVDHLKKNLLTIHPTVKDFNNIWKRACDTAARCIAEAKEYDKPRYDKTHKDPDFREGDQVLVSTLNFNKLKGAKKMIYSFVGQWAITRLTGENEIKVRLAEAFSRKHPMFPVSLVKPDHQTGEDRLHSRIKSHTPHNIVEVENCPGPVRKIMKARKNRLNGKDHRKYLVIFKNQIADNDRWLEEDSIPDGDLHLKGLRIFRRDEQSHQ